MIVKLLRNCCNHFSSISKNPYKSLGIERMASQQQIKQAYYKLAKLHHPDVASNNAQKFRDITQAYSILKDPIKRKQFDRTQDSQSRFNQHAKMNHHYNDFRWQPGQNVRYEYPEYQMNATRTSNKDFLRRRMSVNKQAYQNFYFDQRKQVMSIFILVLIQLLGLIYGIQIIKTMNQVAQIQKSSEHYEYYERDFQEDEEDDDY